MSNSIEEPNSAFWRMNIPPELKIGPHWAVAKLERAKTSKPGDKVRKLAIVAELDPNIGLRGVCKHASSTNPADWRSFDAALGVLDAARSHAFGNPFCGLARVFPPGGQFFFIDLDHCIDPESGEIAPWAAGIIHLFRGTYVEKSVSDRVFIS